MIIAYCMLCCSILLYAVVIVFYAVLTVVYIVVFYLNAVLAVSTPWYFIMIIDVAHSISVQNVV